MCFLHIYVTGTSNATTLTIDSPVNFAEDTNLFQGGQRTRDNGTTYVTHMTFMAAGTPNIMNYYLNALGLGFTASGIKSVGHELAFEMA